MALNQKAIITLLQKGVPTEQWPLYSSLFRETAEGFCNSHQSLVKNSAAGSDLPLIELVEHLNQQVYRQIESVQRIRALAADFNKRVTKAETEDELQEHILNIAADLGSSASDIRKDKKAFKRWFGKDTVLERCLRRIGAGEYKMVFYLTCIAEVSIKSLSTAPSTKGTEQVWQQLGIEKLLETMLAYVGDERLRVAVFRCLARTLKILPVKVRSQAIKDSTLNFIYRSALEARQQVWIQVEALRLLAVLSDKSLEKALRIRLENPKEGDDIFVRRQAAFIVAEHLEQHEKLQDLLPVIVKDPSPYVRQTIPVILQKALALPALKDRHGDFFLLLQNLLLDDQQREVRAASLLIFPDLIKNEALVVSLTELLCRSLRDEDHSFVLRTGLKIFRDTLLILNDHNQQKARLFYDTLATTLEELHIEAKDLSVRRWTAQAINFAEVHLHPAMSALYGKTKKNVIRLELGKSKSLPKKWFKGLEEEHVGRVLALLAEDSGGLTLEQGLFQYRISKGDRFDFRFWRFFHELRHPSPDKRQAHSHTTGRIFRGKIHAPTPIMAELTQTKVPGEPLLQVAESGWRPYLPLVDQLFASLRGVFKGTTIKIFSTEGKTTIVPPASFLKRSWARFLLTIQYSRYAGLRNWREKSGEQPSSYIHAVEKLGFSIVFSSYSGKEEHHPGQTDPTVSRFFTFFSFALDSSLIERIRDYVFSVYENSLYELGLFSGGLLLLFFGLRLLASLTINRARKRIPLVVGGWGTRGKSGVERLKAALFESLGHGILSKSTGCEAMFLHSHQFGRTQEMFLFRPYDKATIWEHHALILMADKLNCSVFLWECMGLTPAYVDILQHKWSRDDFSTITNTYPDHEDIQGPAGYNIPQVMTCFIPEKGTLITTEEQMHPILAEDAHRKKTQFHQLGWLEAGLLTPDILQRFPYEEHPYNIALVLFLAERLGIAPDLALKEMADRVIPDIGVLKAFPKANLNGRTLEFVNGMSANERFATLSNWQRMGFATDADGPAPDTVLHVVVNNRADRISRSRMFASILARDISADRYVLIGSNLAGLSGYILEAWEDYLLECIAGLQDKTDPAPFTNLLTSMADDMRIPYKDSFLRQRLNVMLGAAPDTLDLEEILKQLADPEKADMYLGELHHPQKEALVSHMKEHLLYFREYHALRDKLTTMQADGADLGRELAETLTIWFKRRIVVIEDFHASGDQVIERLCMETPPGLTCRIMGMQNIKGTGLDFVYRWQAWERCWISCNKLREEDEAVFEDGLDELMAFQDYGLLCEEYVQESVAAVRQQSFAQTERFQAGLNVIETNLKINLDTVKTKMAARLHSSGIGATLIDALEAFLDSGDAIRRRKKANAIYKDLAAERISHQRAALELQALNKRQKGGWLARKLKR